MRCSSQEKKKEMKRELYPTMALIMVEWGLGKEEGK